MFKKLFLCTNMFKSTKRRSRCVLIIQVPDLSHVCVSGGVCILIPFICINICLISRHCRPVRLSVLFNLPPWNSEFMSSLIEWYWLWLEYYVWPVHAFNRVLIIIFSLLVCSCWLTHSDAHLAATSVRNNIKNRKHKMEPVPWWRHSVF